MKIAIVADVYFSVPPKKYGGTERVVAYLIEGLQKLGHEVTLFGCKTSQIDCPIIPTTYEEAQGTNRTDVETHVLRARKNAIELLLTKQKEFDVIHWHAGFDKDLDKLTTPVLFTLHSPLLPAFEKDIAVMQQTKNIFYNAISASYIQHNPQLSYVGYVYNGLPVEQFPFIETPQDYISFVGRFSMQKNPHIAIEVSEKLGKKLVIAGKVDIYSHEYFKEIKELFEDQHIENRGEVTESEKKAILGNAQVNLHPVGYEEPFGLTVVEAGLLGTPTIAFDRGSMRELIQDGVSGFLVKDLAEMAAVFPQAASLDRKKVREHFLQFDNSTMARNYVHLYTKMLSKEKNVTQSIAL